MQSAVKRYITYQTKRTQLGGQGGHSTRLATNDPDVHCTRCK